MGTLGYLTEVEVTHIEEAVTQIAEGRYELENRMMLEGVFEGQKEDVALNDIVVCRKGEPHVIHFRLYVNGALLNSYEADGIIISTPTGSTAYKPVGRRPDRGTHRRIDRDHARSVPTH